MTSPILSPGDPGYKEWLQAYRQHRSNVCYRALLLYGICVLVGYLVWLTSEQHFGLPNLYSIALGYVVAGVVVFVFGKIKDYGTLKRTPSNERRRHAIGLMVVAALWPVGIYLIMD